MEKKAVFIITFLFSFSIGTMAQLKPEAEIINLSNTIFKWEVDNNIDSLKMIFDEKFIVVSGDGRSKDKKEYIAMLGSGSFLHNNIDVIENKATVVNNTATVIGKGKFSLTISGNKITHLLSYMEVFTRFNNKQPWQVLAMHATVLEK